LFIPFHPNPYTASLRYAMTLQFQQQHDYIIQKYGSSTVSADSVSVSVTFKPGHIKPKGRTANQQKNPVWEITNPHTGEITAIIMYCEPDEYCELCPKSYQKILEYEANHNKGEKITWYKTTNGYISCHNNVFIHQVIMNTWGNGKGTSTISVDHIDRNPMNNKYDNLRIATMQEQQKNSKGTADDGSKRERKHNARALPAGITQDMMKKYVVYYHEWLNKEHTRSREFFKVEKHPKLEKPWMTSKSEKVSLIQKLEAANKVVSDLEKGIFPENTAPTAVLPKYMSLVVVREKPHLVYERRRPDTGVREVLRMVLPENYTIEDEIVKMKEKVEAKYGTGAMD
jgi:hypothetical protein